VLSAALLDFQPIPWCRHYIAVWQSNPLHTPVNHILFFLYEKLSVVEKCFYQLCGTWLLLVMHITLLRRKLQLTAFYAADKSTKTALRISSFSKLSAIRWGIFRSWPLADLLWRIPACWGINCISITRTVQLSISPSNSFRGWRNKDIDMKRSGIRWDLSGLMIAIMCEFRWPISQQ